MCERTDVSDDSTPFCTRARVCVLRWEHFKLKMFFFDANHNRLPLQQQRR